MKRKEGKRVKGERGGLNVTRARPLPFTLFSFFPFPPVLISSVPLWQSFLISHVWN